MARGMTYQQEYVGGKVVLCDEHAAPEAKGLRRSLDLGHPGAVQDSRRYPECEVCDAQAPWCDCDGEVPTHLLADFSEAGLCPFCGIRRASAAGKLK